MKNGRPGVPRSEQAGFWDGVRSGLGVREAALAAGVGKSKAEVWFRQAGGVKGNGAVSGRYLSVAEREEIALGVAAGQSCRQIAALHGLLANRPVRDVLGIFERLARGMSIRAAVSSRSFRCGAAGWSGGSGP